MQTISAVIFVYNSESEIEECIEAAKLLTEDVIVIDQHSTDDTKNLAEKKDAQVFEFSHYMFVEPAREFGIQKVKSDWFFILDADERLTKELAHEIHTSIENTSYTHFQIARKNIFGKVKWLEHGGWWPDYQTRLISKKNFQGWPKQIHSSPIISGEQGRLTQPFLHYFHGNIAKMVAKTIIFEDIESDLLFKAGKPVTQRTMFRKFFGELNRRLIKNLGFLDGSIGIIESIYQAFSKTITYLYLYEKKNKLTQEQNSTL